uniref:Uncharacterized protein n=1 Tax=Paracidobacterium acidisoli TaxID=2303751 RepID=A0A372IIN2_9BACT
MPAARAAAPSEDWPPWQKRLRGLAVQAGAPAAQNRLRFVASCSQRKTDAMNGAPDGFAVTASCNSHYSAEAADESGCLHQKYDEV